jgi:hypothetical protein
MDKIVSLLQSLLSLNKVASVSVPGILAAVGLAIILWPPRPIDQIPMVEIASQQDVVLTTRACNVAIRPLDSPKTLGDIRSIAVNDQLLLDQQKDKIAQCVELENSRKGFEKTQNDNLALDIADLQKLLNAALDTYSNYEKTDNPLASQFLAKARRHQNDILTKRTRILQNEQSIRNRDLYLAELARYDKIISDRLADPGRLRPRKTFDDLLTTLVNHVVAFILLAIALGVVVTPINQAASAGFFDQLFPEGY